MLYNSNEILSHSFNHFYDNEQSTLNISSLKSLAGTYRTFNTPTTNNQFILKGNLKIEYIQNGNYLETTHKLLFSPNGEKTLYIYRGVINFFQKKNYLVWNDFWESDDDAGLRQSRLKIVPTDNDFIRMDGAMFLNFGDGIYTRNIIIDNKLSEAPEPEKECCTIP